jgi:AcrR family transcriptional regulator
MSARKSGTETSSATSTAAVGLREERRQHRMQLSRNHILDVAEALFSDQGYHQTSLEQVAAGSEYSVGSLYAFFDGKMELLGAVLRRREAEIEPRVTDILQADLPGLDELLALTAFTVDYMKAHPAFARLTMRVYQAGLESIPDFPNYRREAADQRPFAQAVRKGQGDGTIRDGGVIWLATLVEGMIMFDQLARDSAPTENESVDHFLELITDTVAVRSKPSR